MKSTLPSRLLSAALVLTFPASSLVAGTLLFGDNFNATDSGSFDAANLTGRRTGTESTVIQLRSARVQHALTVNQLAFNPIASGSGRVRFQDGINPNVMTDFALGARAAAILAEGGIRVAFDWTPIDNTSPNWVSFSTGFTYIPAEPEVRVNEAETDFGILFRNNGGTQYFDNGAATTGSVFPVPAIATHRVVINLGFTSFADGSNVTVSSSVDGTPVLENYVIQWANNAGVMSMELGNLAEGSRIDNLPVSTVEGLEQTLDTTSVYSSVLLGDLIGTLTAELSGTPEAATFTLVAGQGDTDNGKFRIAGSRLESNGFNFQPLADNTDLSIRVRGTGNVSGSTGEKIYLVRLISDTDSDDLPDAWERANGAVAGAGNLTDFRGRGAVSGSGAGSGNFDGDTLSDLEEFKLNSLGTLVSPRLADTDSDTLEDGAELAGAGSRPPTNPVAADTDKDGLSDAVESNTGTNAGASDTGTNPTAADTDGDLFPDGYEITRGSNPADGLSIPTLPAPFAIVALTTDDSSGISLDKTYTHAISGGYGTSVNGVVFAEQNATTDAGNFSWEAERAGGTVAQKSQIAPANAGEWIAGDGAVTGSGLVDLMSGFTYSGNGDGPGSVQTFTLTGLTPGENYALRLFVRPWSHAGSGRPSSLTFTNGAESVSAYVLEDRPGVMLGNGNIDSAYTLNIPYTAAADSVSIRAQVPLSSLPVSGSWHLYGLTNEVSVKPAEFEILTIAYEASPPAVNMSFSSVFNKEYAVEYSTSLNAAGQPGGWITLPGSIVASGTTAAYRDTLAAGTAPRIFYRIRRLP